MTFSVVLLAMLTFTRAIVSSSMAAEQNHETTLAREAGRSALAWLHAVEFEDAFATFNGTDADDPAGGVVTPGSGIAVEGLTLRDDDGDGFVGEYVFPVRPGAPGVLREDIDLPELGMPRDLNGDGDIDDADHSGDYRILPVLVRVRWRGTKGDAQIEFKTQLADF